MAMNVTSNPTVTVLPYVPPRKKRRPETRRFCVKWQEGSNIHFRWYCRDTPAVAFLNDLTDRGLKARLVMR